MRVFKFGGASVKNSEAVKNVAQILKNFQDDELIVVVSAMGKTTNALEAILQAYWEGKPTEQLIVELMDFHMEIIDGLFPANGDKIRNEIHELFNGLNKKCKRQHSDNYHFEYDQIISLGEIISTKIIHAYLLENGFSCDWIDARTMIRTNNRYREAAIDWEKSEEMVRNAIGRSATVGFDIHITQGFIGHTAEGFTTTLGREGSDFTAAILAYITDAKDVTIWKDVPGMLNADPKYFDNTVLLDMISFKEAIELAYFGASVIHPKTIQPLKKKNIPLYIKSFIHPEEKGSVIQGSTAFDNHIPSFIFKMDQILISLTPKDFSFVAEENLEDIFRYLNKENIRVNLMQNSAVSFSFCVDAPKVDLPALVKHFQQNYLVRYNEKMELVTIRHYDDATIERLTIRKKVYLEQKSRDTARLVIQDI